MAELKKKTICFDLDGVICSQTSGDYENAIPHPGAIELVNSLYEQGYRIVIHTARFMGRNHENIVGAYKSGYHFTFQQLTHWNVKFHELFLGKPTYDLVIDDRSVFFNDNWEDIYRSIVERCPNESSSKV